MSNDRIDEILIKGLDKVDEKCDDIKDEVRDLTSHFTVHESAFKKHLETDEKMYDELHRMNNILQDNTDSLKEHMHRTEVLEQSQSIQNDALLKIDSRLQVFEENEMKKQAVKEYMKETSKRWGKILGLIATLLGIAATAAKLAGWL